jgi:hypothetical protein
MRIWPGQIDRLRVGKTAIASETKTFTNFAVLGQLRYPPAFLNSIFTLNPSVLVPVTLVRRLADHLDLYALWTVGLDRKKAPVPIR